MNTMILEEELAAEALPVHIPEPRDLVIPLFFLLLVLGILLMYQQAQGEKANFLGLLETSNKIVETKTAENTVLTSQIQEIREDVTKIEKRYDAIVAQSMNAIKENKAEIKRLENAAEVLKIERESLRAKVMKYEAQILEQKSLAEF